MRSAIFILAIVLSGCSAQWHIKRAIAKDPSILTEKIVTILDTIIVKEGFQRIDTFVTKEVDTLLIHEKGVNTQIIRFKDRLIVKTEVKNDTIRIIKAIKDYQLIYKEKPKSNKSFWIAFIIGVATAIMFVIGLKQLLK
jgi:putative Mn2+ efflux pump MntP